MRSTPLQPLARWALEQRLNPLRKLDDLSRPQRGWIKAIREALGMTTAQLAARMNLSQPRVVAIERAESNDSITLKTLRHAAESLNCTLVYALVPNEPLDEMIKNRATEIADRQLAISGHTMKLENQSVSAKRLKMARDQLIEELLKGDRRLWESS